jgi:pimeloyl-ACP methyl ester carboxylesterase
LGAMVAAKYAGKHAGMHQQRVQSLVLLGCPRGGLALLRGSTKAWKHWVRQRMGNPFARGVSARNRAVEAVRSFLAAQFSRRTLQQCALASKNKSIIKNHK